MSELDQFGSRAFSAGGGDWPLRGFIVRYGEEVHAYVNRCPHAGHPLNLRPDEFLTDDRRHIVCDSHGAMFDPVNGMCVAGPCPGQALTKLPVRVEDGVVVLDGNVDELVRRYA